jgi:surfeit locus 1 family protein
MLLRKMFSRQWIIPTLFIFVASAVCIRLGIWQLDRLEQRRAFNVQVQAMRTEKMLDLNAEQPDDLESTEWRAVQVTGEYDFANQIAVRNQYYGSQYGYHLFTPLLFAGKAVLVDRGWIPADGNSTAKDWVKYDEVGQVKVTGQIRLGSQAPAFGSVPDAEVIPGQSRLEFWNNIDLEKLEAQIPYPILKIYIQQKPDDGDETPPIPSQPELDLTEGPHAGYALQWFTFAVIFFIGYPLYLKKQTTEKK